MNCFLPHYPKPPLRKSCFQLVENVQVPSLFDNFLYFSLTERKFVSTSLKLLAIFLKLKSSLLLPKAARKSAKNKSLVME